MPRQLPFKIELNKPINLTHGQGLFQKHALKASNLNAGDDKFQAMLDGLGVPKELRTGLKVYDWRVLTAHYLSDYHLDFSDQTVLRTIVDKQMTRGIALRKDHSWRAEDWIGLMGDVYWDLEREGNPPGVNGYYFVDSQKAPDIVRGIEMRALTSSSVGISFNWKRSHPNMEWRQFFDNIGSTIDGELVRIIVTEILEVLENSIVWMGADRKAKRVGVATPGGNSDAEGDQPEDVEEETSEQIAASASLSIPTSKGGLSIMKELLAKFFGKKPEEITDEALPILLRAYVDDEAAKKSTELGQEVTQLKSQVATLSAEKEGLKTQVTQLQPKADLGEKHLTSLRDQAVKLYKLAVDEGTQDAAVITRLQSSSAEDAAAAISLYTPVVEKSVGLLKCSKCGCKEITRQTSQEIAGGEGESPRQSFQQKKAAENAKKYADENLR